MLKGQLALKNARKVENDLNRVFVGMVNKAFRASIKPTQSAIQIATQTFLMNGRFAEAIIHGNLAGHLGFEKGTERHRLQTIVTELVKGIKVVYEPLKYNGGNITAGRLTIGIGKDNFADITGLFESYIITDKLQFLNWVEWTLINGDTVVILGYNIRFGAGLGRSEQAIMIERGGGFWKVPAPFDGTLQDNWITREVENHLAEYVAILEVIINTELKKVSV